MSEYRKHTEGPRALEPYYCRHVSAMTTEHLNAKSEIAEELAVRDKRIAELEGALRNVNATLGRKYTGEMGTADMLNEASDRLHTAYGLARAVLAAETKGGKDG